MDTSKITNVLIFKDGYYYLTTVLLHKDKDGSILSEDSLSYMMINEGMFQHYGIERNGFEFASDAYAYIASLRQKKKQAITLDMEDKVL